MTFDTLVLREVECVSRSDQQIGSDFISKYGSKSPPQLRSRAGRISSRIGL